MSKSERRTSLLIGAAMTLIAGIYLKTLNEIRKEITQTHPAAKTNDQGKPRDPQTPPQSDGQEDVW
ncbi:hypothetical protein [Proteiniclasticum sp. QWL-01]|uniref:hypothetical protein n=1 Tax=Proteiniclasticum sp. QWL-01 TaxID=3036945 RepID=UPI002410A5F1|nr:hypothetical protein [Proteiniclasticum sp. QWL-01]WFF72865.1 hypothetical protein P6M73_16625 [Proteiniclasticum sp. QWL-01]